MRDKLRWVSICLSGEFAEFATGERAQRTQQRLGGGLLPSGERARQDVAEVVIELVEVDSCCVGEPIERVRG